MLVFMVMIVVMVMLMVVIVFFVIMIMVVVVVMLMIVIMIFVVMVMVVVVMMMLMLMLVFMLVSVHRLVLMILFHHLFQVYFHRVLALDSIQQLRTGQLRPGGRDQHRFRISLPDDVDAFLHLLVRDAVRVTQDHCHRIFHLIFKEFPEIPGIHLAFLRIHYRGHGVQNDLIIVEFLHRGSDVGQLPDAGGFDQHPVRVILFHDLREGIGEIPSQRAANAPAVDLVDGHFSFLEETAVDPNISEFVLDENQLFIFISFFQKFFDQGRFPCA